MRNLIDFLVRYFHCILFLLLEGVSLGLLFHYNSFQGSVYLSAANGVAGEVYDAANALTSYLHLKTVNDELMERNILLEQQLSALRREFAESRGDSTASDSLLHAIVQGFRLVRAEVVNNSVRRADNFVTIDKGEADGVQPEMGVADGRGVVGIVYQTTAHYALVLPVLNSKSSISCKIADTGYFGYLKWDGKDCRYAYLMDLPRHSVCERGDTVVTSGFTPIFPEGLMVGTVDKVGDSHDGLSYLLRVKLFTDFARLGQVQVLARSDTEEWTELEERVP